MSKIFKKLSDIQTKLKVSKENFNAFGKYKYRSCEDILEGVKPLLSEFQAILTLSDSVEQIGERFYIKATANLVDIEDGETISVSAYAREDLDKKGMDLAQVTGSVSSYARKYALNGLFCIDDTKDSDSTNTHGQAEKKPTSQKWVIAKEQIEKLVLLAKESNSNLKIMGTEWTKKTDSSQWTEQDYNKVLAELMKLKGAKTNE